MQDLSLHDMDGAERLMAGLLYGLMPLVFGIVFLNFILAILVWPFRGLKTAARNQPTIFQVCV